MRDAPLKESHANEEQFWIFMNEALQEFSSVSWQLYSCDIEDGGECFSWSPSTKLSLFENLSIDLNSNFRIRTGEKLMDVRRVGNEFLQLFFAASGERWANNGVVFHSRTKTGPANGVMKHHSPTKQQKIAKLERLFGINIMKQRTNPKFSKTSWSQVAAENSVAAPRPRACTSCCRSRNQKKMTGGLFRHVFGRCALKWKFWNCLAQTSVSYMSWENER